MNDREELRLHIPSGTIIKVFLIAILFFLAYYLRQIVLVVIAAVVIASSIEPSVKWFIDRKIPRVVAVLLIYLCLALLFVGAFYFLLVPLFGDVQQFLEVVPKYLGALSGETVRVTGSSVFGGIIDTIPFDEITAQTNAVLGALSQSFFSTASVFLGGFLSLLLIIVLSFYLAVQQEGITNFLRTISPIKHRKYVVGLWNRAETKIGLWLQGQLLLGVIVGVLTYLGLTLLGVQHALLLGFVAGIFELIPLFGPILAAIPAIAVAFLNGGVTISFIVAGLYLIIQQFESQLIYPLVVKKVVGVPPIISIIAIVIGAKLAGFLGILLAVPVAAILMEFFHDLERDRLNEEQTGK